MMSSSAQDDLNVTMTSTVVHLWRGQGHGNSSESDDLLGPTLLQLAVQPGGQGINSGSDIQLHKADLILVVAGGVS
jgi:hypothetical protein